MQFLYVLHPHQANILGFECTCLSFCSFPSVLFMSLVHKCLPKSWNQTSASLRKSKAKQGDTCFIFHLFSDLNIFVVQPQIMTLVLNPLSWHHGGVWKVLFVLVNPRENKEGAEPSHWRAGTPLAPQEMVLLQPWKHPLAFALSPPSPIQASCWSWGHFPSLSQVLWYLPVQGSWLWCDKSCLPSSSVNTTTVPLWSASSPAGHSSLCAFPDFQDLCSLMQLFRHSADGDSPCLCDFRPGGLEGAAAGVLCSGWTLGNTHCLNLFLLPGLNCRADGGKY